ncbi:MAG: hypothetical protein WCC25_00360 [Candidatus Korobacteraceae bacterium]
MALTIFKVEADPDYLCNGDFSTVDRTLVSWLNLATIPCTPLSATNGRPGGFSTIPV